MSNDNIESVNDSENDEIKASLNADVSTPETDAALTPQDGDELEAVVTEVDGNETPVTEEAPVQEVEAVEKLQDEDFDAVDALTPQDGDALEAVVAEVEDNETPVTEEAPVQEVEAVEKLEDEDFNADDALTPQDGDPLEAVVAEVEDNKIPVTEDAHVEEVEAVEKLQDEDFDAVDALTPQDGDALEAVVAEVENNETPVTEDAHVEEVEAVEKLQDEDFDADEHHEEDDAEDHHDADHDDASNKEEEREVDFSTLDKDGLMQAAKTALNLMPREGLKRIRDIRPLFNEILRAEKRAALEAFIEEGHEPEGFEFDDNGYSDKFKEIYDKIRDARTEERERIEKEKLKNYEVKKAILEKLSKITESDETEQSLAEVKELQQEWKKIRVVPAEHSKELWDTYHFYLDKFYDNHSINIELKELDRKKNLEIKIDLCKKVDELSKENSLKRSFILLNKYQEEFRNTGPVPREYNKDIWERFQQACDKLYEQKKVIFEELESERKKNLELKQVLVEKASLVAATGYPKQKDWREKSGELDQLMSEWKKIGPVTKNQNEAIWKEFRASFNTFYENKSQFFKQINKDRKANLILKEDICKRAEELKDSDDFAGTSTELIRLQNEWKGIGTVPEKVSNAVWKRFRGACDHFFERKNQQFASRREEETVNLKNKEDIINRLNELLNSEMKADDLLNQLKEIQKSWNQIGFVPFKRKKEVDDRYHKASDKVFEKFKIDRQGVKSGQVKEHYKHLAELPSGDRRLNEEEQKIRKKMSFLVGEIQTLENNMEFFGRSAGSQKLKKEIEDKIQKTRDQIDRLKAELKAIKGVKAKEEAANSAES